MDSFNKQKFLCHSCGEKEVQNQRGKEREPDRDKDRDSENEGGRENINQTCLVTRN